MGKVVTGFSISLDGFIADPRGDVGRLFDWYTSGDTEVRFPGGMVVRVSPQSAKHIREMNRTTGALVSGRRQFDIAGGWGGRHGGKHPMDVLVFVVTHKVPQERVYEGSPFTFVTDGVESAVESAVEQAKAVAGEKSVGVDGANVAQQAIKAGLVDEIFVDLVPVLFGEGIRFFDHLGPEHIELERTRVIEAPDVTHLWFRVVK